MNPPPALLAVEAGWEVSCAKPRTVRDVMTSEVVSVLTPTEDREPGAASLTARERSRALHG